MALELTLTPEFTVEKDNGNAVIKVKDENAFVAEAEKNGIEKSTLDKVAKFKKAYLHASVEVGAAKAQEIMAEDADIKTAEVTTPNGIAKADVIKTFVQRSREIPIPVKPGEEKRSITKSVIKNVVVSTESTYPKSKRKALEEKMTAALLSV